MRPLHHYLPRPVLSALKNWREQRGAQARHRQAIAQLQAAAVEISRRCLAGCATLEEWVQVRPQLRAQLQWMLGLDPLPPRSPLQPEVCGRLVRTGYVVEKLIYESVPGLRVTANLYLPAETEGPVPCVLYLCGHMIHPCGAKTQYQDRFLWYPAHGFACLAVDSLECGEIPGWHHGTHSLSCWEWFALGYTPAGLEVWSAMRALDYLATRPEVDARRLGVTGISGGGVMSWYLAALDERIQAAAPSCSTYTIGSQARLGLVGSQCDCTFYPNVHGHDFPVVGALIAPRPLLLTSGRRDRIFPPPGFREVYRRVRGVYALYGAGPGGEDRVQAVESDAGHTDPPLFLEASRRWMCQWLHPDPSRVLPATSRAAPAPEDPKALACVTRPPREALNYTVHRHFVPAAPLGTPSSAQEWRVRRQQVIDGLKRTVFAWFPPAPPAPAARRVSGSGIHAGRFSHFGEWEVETEAATAVRVHVFQPKAAEPPHPLLVLVRRAEDWAVFPDDELLPLLATHRVVVLSPRFTEMALHGADHAAVERTAALTGRTIAALQVWDTLQVVRWALREQPAQSGDVSVYGRGAAGVVALYAALFDDRIRQVILDRPPASHRESPPLLTILRLTDLPEVAGLLAPRTLTLLSAPPGSWDLTRVLYRLSGAEAAFQQVGALPMAWRPATG
jgi:cephalosporin-C deacetylase-like acetyl esterase